MKKVKKQMKKQQKQIIKSARRARVQPSNRVGVRRVRGRGGFFSDVADFMKPVKDYIWEPVGQGPSRGRAALNALGAGVAGRYLGPQQAQQGAQAGDMLASIFGMGSYTVRKNSLMAGGGGIVETTPVINRPPHFASVGGNTSDIVFSHSEYITDVLSSTGFSATAYYNNPGNPVIMPWASQIAQLFEEFEWLGVLYTFRPTSAAAVGTTNSAMGVVVIATEYDAYDAGYGSKRQMEAAEFASSAVPYKEIIHPIECDPQRNVTARSYVAPGYTNITGLQGDARLYMPSITTVATQGQQVSGQVIGELWITYHVRCSRPILEFLNGTAFTQHAMFTQTIGSPSTSTNTLVTNTSQGGAGFSIGLINTPGSALTITCNNQVALGRYSICITGTPNNAATTAAWVAPAGETIVVLAGSPQFTQLGSRNGVLDVSQVEAGGAGNTNFWDAESVATCVYYFQVSFNTANDSIQIPLLTSATYASTYDVWIQPLNTLLQKPAEREYNDKLMAAVQRCTGKSQFREIPKSTNYNSNSNERTDNVVPSYSDGPFSYCGVTYADQKEFLKARADAQELQPSLPTVRTDWASLASRASKLKLNTPTSPEDDESGELIEPPPKSRSKK